ncbi:DUF4307 domain-containing protein [Zafaria sp. Z1313]|uniref:DUF4307 domain-containing protein n=1 Tax=unclassified Zafaria TaxID=2828765 RepID=UPI002E75B4CB|nr:DUF4307 domain-containing protein [Zafaria sp. J156]MEE1619924.1 DUF4307 domain-containing protein [Zafaria sp. J156]
MTSHQPAPASGSGGAPETSLANRYGAPKRTVPARIRNLAIAAALAISVGAAGAVALLNAAEVNHKDISFSISSPTAASVTFDVDKPVGTAVECSARVLDESYAVVGWTAVSFPAGEGGGREVLRRTVELRTEHEGVSGGVGACWTP